MITETKRLILRKFTTDDVSRVTELLEDGEVNKTTQNVPYPYTEARAYDWINLHSVWFANGTQIVLAVVLKETDEVIGTISVSNRDKVGELGYWYGVDYWNQGYGTEAAQAFIDYLFNELNFHRIHARFLVTNPGSGEIMKKIGMTKEGTMKEHIKKGDEYLDVDYYGILQSEYYQK